MTNPLFLSSLLAPLFSSEAMRAVVDDRTRLQRMLDFEFALARAEATVGVIPASAVAAIGDACHAEHYDIDDIGKASVAAGNILIPLVKALTAEVAKRDSKAASFVHWGATSQDVIDTTLVLELRAGIKVLDSGLARAVAGFSSLAQRYRNSPAVGRTWLQHAVPMPFGLKLAGYAAALARSRERIARAGQQAIVLQFGGAVGTLASLGERGLEVGTQLATELDLPLPDAPWHSHRDRLGELASALAILAGTCGKIARDVTLMMQTEVGEAFEPAAAGRGGSSTMPHKRNPVAAAAILACVQMAPQLAATILASEVQEHERSAGAWPVEWPTFPALLLVVSGALAGIVDIAEGLEVDETRMRANLDATDGLIMAEAVAMALAAKIGKPAAHKLVEEASRKAVTEKKSLKDIVCTDAGLTRYLARAELERLFDPSTYQGAAQAFIDRQLAAALDSSSPPTFRGRSDAEARAQAAGRGVSDKPR
ncbi:MAG: 3-carboxy-cis,cis-muconate cycloisomerase [Rhizobiales bacterium]|nr:3-carboxy-cis,cis-muconate cycloisomerase [Hyphomicrobiales bacterium]